jgi:hypothetical protein
VFPARSACRLVCCATNILLWSLHLTDMLAASFIFVPTSYTFIQIHFAFFAPFVDWQDTFYRVSKFCKPLPCVCRRLLCRETNILVWSLHLTDILAASFIFVPTSSTFIQIHFQFFAPPFVDLQDTFYRVSKFCNSLACALQTVHCYRT